MVAAGDDGDDRSGWLGREMGVARNETGKRFDGQRRGKGCRWPERRTGVAVQDGGWVWLAMMAHSGGTQCQGVVATDNGWKWCLAELSIDASAMRGSGLVLSWQLH